MPKDRLDYSRFDGIGETDSDSEEDLDGDRQDEPNLRDAHSATMAVLVGWLLSSGEQLPEPEAVQEDPEPEGAQDEEVEAWAKKVHAALDKMPSWPSFLHGWVKQQMGGGDADEGAVAIIDTVLKDSQGMLGLQGESDELKAAIKGRLLSGDYGAVELVKRHAAGLG